MNHHACMKNASGKRENPLSLYLDIALALCAAFALVLDLNVRSGNTYVNWAESLPNTPVTVVLFAALLFVFRRAGETLPDADAGTWVLSLFLGFWWVLVKSVANTQELNQPFLSSGQMLKTAVITLGMAGLYQLFFRALAYALDQGTAWKLKPDCRLGTRALSVYEKHTVLSCMVLLLLVWLPHYVIAFPCAMNSDSTAQLMEWLGIYRFSTHHPPFGSMLIGLFYEAGLMLGDGGVGLALYVAVQMTLSAAVLGYMQDVMRRLGAPLWLRLLALFAACFCPVYCDNITTIIKDVPYAYGMALMMCELARCIFCREEKKVTAAGLLRLFAGGMFVMLMRNNGKYALIPLVICLAAWAVKRPALRMTVCTLAVSIVLSQGIGMWMTSAFDIVAGSPAEALSLPFQQTARFFRDHEEEIPQEELDAIEAVIGVSGLGRAYDPVISDPVKARFRREATAEDMQRYFSVWLKQFFRDPACYVKATLIQNVLLLDPQTWNLAIFSGTGIDEEMKEKLSITEPDTFEHIRDMEENLRALFMTLPGMAQLNSLGFHCCMLLFVCLWSVKRKHLGMLMILLPMVISVLVIVAGPCIQNQDRYGFPIIYCMPLVLSCLSFGLRAGIKEER